MPVYMVQAAARQERQLYGDSSFMLSSVGAKHIDAEYERSIIFCGVHAEMLIVLQHVC